MKVRELKKHIAGSSNISIRHYSEAVYIGSPQAIPEYLNSWTVGLITPPVDPDTDFSITVYQRKEKRK